MRQASGTKYQLSRYLWRGISEKTVAKYPNPTQRGLSSFTSLVSELALDT